MELAVGASFSMHDERRALEAAGYLAVETVTARGEFAVAGEAPDGMRYFELGDLPLDSVASIAERSMLSRYIREYRHGAFGLYHGTETEGVVHAVAERSGYTHKAGDPT